ncbi:GTP 3',8-cyclase MoaA [Actinomycetaceae bacterium MB13-C1-2]|nr:GTP 3',8-cyclase MoaA [Actinomycetaceae bacterium MB13-C1-2]
MAHLVDSFGRVARDLRISLTDKCNLRCTYCMPSSGLDWLPTEETLTDEEVVRLMRIAVQRFGIRKLRFTGGEPLMRKGLEEIVKAASSLRTEEGLPPDLALTTNGLGLDKRLQRLIDAGLNRVNVSLDTMDPVGYAKLTRRDRLDDVMRSIRAVDEAGLRPLKINSVIMRETNEDAVLPLADFCLSNGYQLRFIEQMPLGPKHTWDRRQMVTQQEILDTLGTRYKLSPEGDPDMSAPATLWDIEPDDTQPGGQIGIIASVTDPFCATCDRTRITSDGQIRSCLFSLEETDLRSIMRKGGTDEELMEAWLFEQHRKPLAHGINEQGFEQPDRTMSEIGG